MNKKLERTDQIIDSCVNTFLSTMMYWSGGKDSMVLLHLLRRHGVKIPILFFREPWQPFKYEFHDRIIRDWELLVYSWHPYESLMQEKNGEFEVQNRYAINGYTISCPTGIVDPVDDLPCTSCLEILRRPKQKELLVPYLDAIWIGHKGSDTDSLAGDVGIKSEVRQVPGGVSSIFPLRDWTDEDVWNYIEEHDVPYDEKRYEKFEGKWRERPDRRHNADYVHACTRSVDRREGAEEFPYCRKLKTTVQNMAQYVVWTEPVKPDY